MIIPTPVEWPEEQLKNAPLRSEEWAKRVARIYCLDIGDHGDEEEKRDKRNVTPADHSRRGHVRAGRLFRRVAFTEHWHDVIRMELDVLPTGLMMTAVSVSTIAACFCSIVKSGLSHSSARFAITCLRVCWRPSYCRRSRLSSAATRVVYVDPDPVVLAHSRNMLHGVPNTAIIEQDLLTTDEILADPALRNLIDFSQPTAILLLSILHLVSDSG